MVYMHIDQVLADGLDEKGSNDRRVNTTGQRQQHFLVTYLCFYSGDLLLDKSVSQGAGGNSFHFLGTFVFHKRYSFVS